MLEHVFRVVTTAFQLFNIRGTVCLATFNIQKAAFCYTVYLLVPYNSRNEVSYYFNWH